MSSQRTSLCGAVVFFSLSCAMAAPLAAQTVAGYGSGQDSRVFVAGHDVVVNNPGSQPLAVRSTGKKARRAAARAALTRLGLPFEIAALADAAGRGDVLAVGYFLDAGMSPDQWIDDYGRGTTPLVESVREGQMATFLRLLRGGADPAIKSRFWGTPLAAAAKFDRPELVAVLLRRKLSLEVKSDALRTASSHGRVGILRAIYKTMSATQGLKDELLQLAAGSGEYKDGLDKCVAFLLQQGADADAVDGNNRSSVSWAAERATPATLRLLLQHATQLETRDADFAVTALWYAAGSKELESVELLADRGAKLDVADKAGVTALIRAASMSDGAITRYLIEHGANVRQGEARLDLVFDSELLELLIAAGADPNAAHDERGATPLIRAVVRGSSRNCALLLAHRAQIDAVDQDGWSALMYAVDHGKIEISRMLIDHSARTDIRSSDGITALDIARKYRGEADVRTRLLTLLAEGARSRVNAAASARGSRAP